MNKTNIGLVEYAQSKLNLPTIYFLSGFGRRLTEAAIQSRINKGDSFTKDNASTIRTGIGKYAFDCCGLIKGYLWEETPGLVDYNIPVGSDQNSQGQYEKATEKGSLETMPDIKGLLVFTADLGHVGIYVGKVNGIRQYIEATPAWEAWGVTTSADSGHAQRHNRKWTYWGKYHLIEYLPEQPIAPLVMLDVSGKQYETGESVWIRKEPTTSAEKLGLFPPKTIVPIMQISQDQRDGYTWVKLTHLGITGYCAIIDSARVTDITIIVEEPVENEPDSDIVETPIVIEPVEPEPEIVVPVVVEPEPTPEPNEPIQEPTPIEPETPSENSPKEQTTYQEPKTGLWLIVAWLVGLFVALFTGKHK